MIFYCAYQVVAVTGKITVSLKILLAISFLPVLMRGVILLELAAWFLLVVLPTISLVRAFSKPKISGTQI